jgi:hypothetical protein
MMASISGCGQAKTDSSVKSDGAQSVQNSSVEGAGSSDSENEKAPLPIEGNDTDIEMYEVDSSCFSEIGYDPDEELLLVRFKDSGSLYSYSDVPEDVYDEFESSDSLGGYYNDYIKGQYDCDRLE